jgi:hypothetical protein
MKHWAHLSNLEQPRTNRSRFETWARVVLARGVTADGVGGMDSAVFTFTVQDRSD